VAGIFQVGPDISGGPAQREFLARLKRVALESGRPVMFGTISSRQGSDPNPWTYQLDYLDECAAAGARVWGQTTTRSINAIFSLKSYLPFDVLPAWRELLLLPLAEQKRRLADPTTRRQLVAEEAAMKPRDKRVPGRRCGHHRPAPAGLRQPLRDGRTWSGTTRRWPSSPPRGASIPSM